MAGRVASVPVFRHFRNIQVLRMKRIFRTMITLLPVMLLAFSPAGNDRLENYYSFRSLRNAQMPQKMRVLKVLNSVRNKSLIEEGVLLTYRSREAKRVDVAGTFSNWRPVRMERGEHGVWFYLLTETPGQDRVKYKFIVDGLWTSDPQNPWKSYDGNGSYVSMLEPVRTSEGRNLSFRVVDKNLIEFRIYRPEARFISIVGDFNSWNPENDLLEKGDDGVWRLTKRLGKGAYRYKYIVDGKWQPDYFNSNSASDEMGGICSVVRIR